MKRTLSITATLALVTWTAAARAQDSTAPGADGADVADATAVPTFATLDRMDGHSRFHLSSSITLFDGNDPDFNNRLDLYGQYISPSGAGGYASIPLATVRNGDASDSGIGSLEIGGIYAPPRAPLPLVLRAGLGLPTASDDEPTVLFLGLGRLTDLLTALPDITWGRLSGSLMFRQNNLFLRLDGGIDLVLDGPEGSDSVVHFNGGAGVITGPIALSGELVTLAGSGDTILSTAVSVRSSRTTGIVPFFAAVIPFGAEGDLPISAVLMGGLEYTPGR